MVVRMVFRRKLMQVVKLQGDEVGGDLAQESSWQAECLRLCDQPTPGGRGCAAGIRRTRRRAIRRPERDRQRKRQKQDHRAPSFVSLCAPGMGATLLYQRPGIEKTCRHFVEE